MMVSESGLDLVWTWLWETFSIQMHSKIDAKFNVEKVWTNIGKCFQNEKSMIFQTLRFLEFCEEYNVKIVFSHDQGYQKTFKIQ